MAVKNFIPEIWSAQLLTSLKKSLVYGAPDVANRNYEGEIGAWRHREDHLDLAPHRR